MEPWTFRLVGLLVTTKPQHLKSKGISHKAMLSEKLPAPATLIAGLRQRINIALNPA